MDLSLQRTGPVNVGSGERWVSALGGTALVVYGLRQRSLTGTAVALLGAGLVYRGATGHSNLYKRLNWNTTTALTSGIGVRQIVTVNKSPEETYWFWRKLDNLPHFMSHVRSVRELENGRTHWVVDTAGLRLDWNAEITEDRPGEVLAWQTEPESSVEHSGMVRFRPAPGNRGTEVAVVLRYDPPYGMAGELFAQFLNIVTAQQIKEDIRQFKSIMEAGEVPTVAGQPSGRRSGPVGRLMAEAERVMA